MLLRCNWEAAQGRRHLMAKCCRKWTFSRRLQMKRGDYSGKRPAQMNGVVRVQQRAYRADTTKVLPPDCGEVLPLLSQLAMDKAPDQAA